MFLVFKLYQFTVNPHDFENETIAVHSESGSILFLEFMRIANEMVGDKFHLVSAYSITKWAEVHFHRICAKGNR